MTLNYCDTEDASPETLTPAEFSLWCSSGVDLAEQRRAALRAAPAIHVPAQKSNINPLYGIGLLNPPDITKLKESGSSLTSSRSSGASNSYNRFRLRSSVPPCPVIAEARRDDVPPQVVYKSNVESKLAQVTTVTTSIVLEEEVWKFNARIKLVYAVSHEGGSRQVPEIPEILRQVSNLLGTEIYALIARYAAELTPQELQALLAALADAVQTEHWVYAAAPKLPIKDWLPPAQKAILAEIDAKNAKAILQVQDYHHSFGIARSICRKLHANLGPTNSGKTWEALAKLAQASSGVYLAPLRLLAIEVWDKLNSQGVPCNLLTGEERVLVPGARHTASTIEMLNPTELVDVAVIDEIQMLDSPDRGWAWTAALVGVPARDVYLCGSAYVQGILQQAADALNEPLTVNLLYRKNPLVVAPMATASSEASGVVALEPGDAVIAFTRRDVLTLSARYREQGWKVATIYGALSPEVRKAEAIKFSSGAADILVATDAIGMGLNLPIKRVVFSSVSKYDGTAHRLLRPSELQQIGGRAGRYGLHDTGVVTAIEAEDLEYVKAHLFTALPPYTGKLAIAPNEWHLQALASTLGTQNVGHLLYFVATQLTESPLFKPSSLDNSIALGYKIDMLVAEAGIEVPLGVKFTLSCAPVDLLPITLNFYLSCVKAVLHRKQKKLSPYPSWLARRDPSHRTMPNLELAELLTRNLTLYTWLSFKFPDIFVDGAKFPEYKAMLSAYVEAALRTQPGFGLTSKERKRLARPNLPGAASESMVY